MNWVEYFDQVDVVEEDLERQRDYHDATTRELFQVVAGGKGVEKGYLQELEVYTPDPNDLTKCFVRAGRARVEGRKASSSEVTEMALPGGVDHILSVKHAWEWDPDAEHEPPRSTRKDPQGADHEMWFLDGFEFKLTAFDLWQNPADELDLARVCVVNDQLQITDRRQFLRLQLPVEDGAIGTPQVADAAITEPKLALGTDAVLLYGSEVVKPVAGELAFDHEVTPPQPVGERLYVSLGALEYKAVGFLPRVTTAGPLRRIRVEYTYAAETQDVDSLTVWLVAWRHDDQPSDYDPREQGNGKLIMAYKAYNGPSSGEDGIELDLTSLVGVGRTVWGLVLASLANGQSESYLENVLVYGLR